MTVRGDSYIRPTRAIVDLDRLRANWRAITACLEAHTRILAVVKANAYGHGSLAIANACARLGGAGVGVADMGEALDLRAGGYRGDLLCFGALTPDAVRAARWHGVAATVHAREGVELLEQAAGEAGDAPLRVHVEVETGMHRLGLEAGEWASCAARLAKLPAVRVEGVFTHLAESEARESAFTRAQLALFADAVAAIEGACGRRLVRHVANSGGVLGHPAARLDWVRPGIALYGYAPGPAFAHLGLSPVLEWRAPIIQMKEVRRGDSVGYNRAFVADRDLRVATVAVGYGDGYRRGYAGVGVGVRGQRCRVLGLVCMDLMMVDVTAVPDARVHDEVVLLGDPASGGPDAQELAASVASIPYEVMTGIKARVTREVRGAER
jgi:alanine racemase